MRNRYFFIGLAVLYFGFFISTGWKIYFLAYLITGLFFYLSVKNIFQTIYLIAVASIPYSIGPFRTQAFSPGTPFSSSYGIIPFTLSTVFLTISILFKSIPYKFKKADLILLLFFIYSVIGFIINPLQISYLYGLLQLGVLISFYFVSRYFLADKKLLSYINWIFISILAFESIVAAGQFLLQRPLGLYIEEFLRDKPYGVLTPENISLFRSPGTLSHPNHLGTWLVALSPFLFTKEVNILRNKKFIFLILVGIIISAIIFTFSRANWGLLSLFILFLFWQRRKSIVKKINYSYLLITLIFFGILTIFSFPFVSYRLSTLPIAVTDWGSIGLRFKVAQIALSVINESPVFGVGLNQFLTIAPEYSEEYIFNPENPSAATLVHNIFMQITAELGIPALILFILFLYFIFREFINNKEKRRNLLIQASVVGMLLFLGAGLFNPFFLRPVMRLFFLLSAIILA